MGAKEVIDVPMFVVREALESSSCFDPHFAATASSAGARRFP
jgi:hypothetical protein